MAEVGGISVRISLERSSQRFVYALARLMAAIDNADPALLEDGISEAHAEMKAALQDRPSLGFEEDD